MKEKPETKVICQVCGQEKELNEVWPGELVLEGVQEAIRKRFPQWSKSGYICIPDLNLFRSEYIKDVLEEEMGEISVLQEKVSHSLKEHELISRNLNVEFEKELTVWERLSDRVAAFGGSWGFILTFFVIIVVWVVVNSLISLLRPFDPYPYIFLNLVLSLMAAIQAPIILMSQNRQDSKDRLRSEYDYRLNLKAELEVRHLNEKMDLLLTQQWRRLLEIQHVQLAVMEELACKAPPTLESRPT